MIDIFTIPTFRKKIKNYSKKYKGLKKDYKTLLDTLSQNPSNGILIKEDIYKIRLKNSNLNKGKSAGYRVYYFYRNSKNKIVLLYIYSKNEQSNLSNEDLDKLIIELHNEFDDLD